MATRAIAGRAPKSSRGHAVAEKRHDAADGAHEGRDRSPTASSSGT